MFGWRVFLTLIGAFYGALVGLFVVGLTQWLNDLVILLVAGAILGAVGGWTFFPRLKNAIDKWNQKLIEKQKAASPPIPPPSGVIRLGYALGMAEGIVIGATEGGWMAAIMGGFIGGHFGMAIAILSWSVRRNISVLILSLLSGFLIEVAGCLLITYFIKQMPINPVIVCVFGATFLLFMLRQLFPQWFNQGYPQQEGNADPEPR